MCTFVYRKPKLIQLPDLTTICWIHFWFRRAIKIFCKLFHITKRSDNSKFVRWMNACQDSFLHCFGSENSAPCLSRCDPKELIRWEVQTGKFCFDTVDLCVFLVRVISFFKTSIVSDIFSLKRQISVDFSQWLIFSYLRVDAIQV